MNSLKPLGERRYIPPEKALEELEGYSGNDRSGEGSDSGENKGNLERDAVAANIENPRDYIQVPGVNGIHGNPVVISKFEVQGMNKKNYEDTHRAAFQLQKGLYIPTPAIFMPHFKNVVETYKNNQLLLNAEGNPIRREEHEEIYRHLTTNFKDVYNTNQPGAWTWLNARFVPGKSPNSSDLETIIGINPDGDFETRKEPLLQCLSKDAYAEIVFNSQGFPTQKSRKQEYKQGENLYYWKPVNGRVARFYADSDRVDLNCDRDPGNSNSALGVFLCAEGTPKNIK